MTPERQKALRDLLAFYREAGVDALLGEAPVNRLEEPPGGGTHPATAADRAQAPSPTVARKAETGAPMRSGASSPPATSNLPLMGGSAAAATPPAPETAIVAAREAAAQAKTLDELRAILDRFDGCALRLTATQLVFADGNPQARVMFVGEAPGRDEDIEGLPFVGRSGKLLDRMMAAIGLDRTSAYIANIIPWRPPGNRTPTPQESQTCLPFIKRQIALANPDVLVCLGGPSAQTLLQTREGILKTRGRWFNYRTGEREIRAMATLHPAYLLRQPLQKRLAWRDFLAIRKVLAE